jgi:hypothetical protein
VLRYVLAVLVAVAVVGVALPAMERAEVRHDGDRLGREARRLTAAADRLGAATDPGGRDLVTVHLPERTRGDGRYLWVDPLTDTVRWQVDGGRERRLRVEADLFGRPHPPEGRSSPARDCARPPERPARPRRLGV